MIHRPRMANFLTTDIYGITGEEFSAGRSNIEVVRQLLAAGVKIIQYREKAKEARDMYEECLALREMTTRAGATFIVNDRVDLAMMVAADGVHVGQEDLPPGRVRELVGADMLVGLSTHTPETARAAENLAGIIDYIGVGPVYATGTKKDASAPTGLELVAYVTKNIKLPFVAIGGIKEGNIGDVRRHGAQVIALISDLVGAPDIAAKVRALRAELAEDTHR